MTNILVEGREQVELADIGLQAERAKKILAKVRKAMLAPNVQKEAPHFSPAQLGSLVNLDTRQIDLGLLRPPALHGDLVTLPCLSEPLVLALPEASARDWPRQPTLKSLHRQPFLTYSPFEARYFHHLVDGLLERAGVAPDIVEHVTQIHSMLALVRAGLGVALVPESASMLRPEGVVYRPIRTTPACPVSLLLAWRKDNDNPVLASVSASLPTWMSGAGQA